MKSFGDQYLENSSHYAEWRERPVYGSIRLEFARPTGFTISARFKTDILKQYVGVRFRKRRGEISGRIAERFLIADTAAFPIDARIRARKPPFTVVIWNAWAGSFGAPIAWVNNAGLIVEDLGEESVVLKGNAGPSPIQFDDIEITLRWPGESGVSLVLPAPREI